MLGYTSVVFAEICRLCATNLPVKKINIFSETGKILQLQNKIEALLSMKVTEADHLPKVVCSKCLVSLEDCANFRNVCILSESMLSKYYNSAQNNDEFIETGKVYIKNTPATQIGGKKFLVLTRNKHEADIIKNDLVPFNSNQLESNQPVICTEEVVVSYPEDHTTKEKDGIKTIETGPSLKPRLKPKETITVVNSPKFSPIKVKPKPKPPKPEAYEYIIDVDQEYENQEVFVKIYPCQVCDKVFKCRENLYQHGKLHTGMRPFQCSDCLKDFIRKEHLLRHSVCHTGQKNFTCQQCGKSFSRRDNLHKHERIHEKPGTYHCLPCDKVFVRKYELKEHLREFPHGPEQETEPEVETESPYLKILNKSVTILKREPMVLDADAEDELKQNVNTDNSILVEDEDLVI